jgi:tRNA(fMet)-specific endonuclease VapC
MIYMLDTNICSYIIRERPASILKHYETFLNHYEDTLCISAITCSELLYGVQLKPTMHILVDGFINSIEVLGWGKEAAHHYADIRAYLKPKGIIIGAHDMQIAGHARSLGAKVITNNEKHFNVVPGIIVENWA